MGLFDETVTSSSGTNLQIFSGNTPLAHIGNAVANQGLQYAKAKVSTNNLPYFNAAVNLASGDYMGAFNSVVNSTMLNRLFKNRRGATPISAGLSLEEVQRIVMTSHHLDQVRKNLFLINVSDYSAKSGLTRSLGSALSNVVSSVVSAGVGGKLGQNLSQMAGQATKMLIASNPITSGLNEIGGGITSNFNLLATNVSYTPIQIESEVRNVGAALVDGVKSAGKAEISITTMDTEQGFIKNWFKQKSSQAIHADGTVGVLADSLVQIRILHGFVSDNTNNGGFEEVIICRPVGVDYEFDRLSEEMQTFTMRFEQTDTFIR